MIEIVDVKTHPYVSVVVDGADGWERLFRDEVPFAAEAVANRRKRDRGSSHHITVADWREAKKHRVEVPEFVTFETHGIGHVSADDGREAWFVVVTSPELDEARAAAGLPRKDFHITLGFLGGDVHGVSKGMETIVYE